jgi:hypothetical protein
MSDAGPASGPHLNADSHSTPIRCAHCEGQAYFVRVQAGFPGIELRTFERADCKKETRVPITP